MKRKSKYRDVIIRILRSTASHPSAEWIYKQAKKEMPGISMATVYRNLKSLLDAGEIVTIKAPNSTVHFDGNVKMHNHFCCDNCGQIIDIDIEAPVDLPIISKLADKTGLEITRYNLELGGLCLNCQKQGVVSI